VEVRPEPVADAAIVEPYVPDPSPPVPPEREPAPAAAAAEAFAPVPTAAPAFPVLRTFGGPDAESAPGPSGITVDVPPPRPLGPIASPTTRLTYALVGLLGVMLFSGALVSMFRQANVANLVTGLVGVAFMAPAAGHFLFAVLAGRPSRSAVPWA
jgi:hypothetical protein